MQIPEKQFNDIVNYYLSTQKTSHSTLLHTANEFGISFLKVRKILITAGVFSTKTSREINRLAAEGKSIEEIQELLQLSRTSVNSYLPYSRDAFCAQIPGADAEDSDQKRQMALEELKRSVERAVSLTEADGMGELDDKLWETLTFFQKDVFHTAKGLEYDYRIKGNEMFVSRKDKSITKATVLVAFHKAIELRRTVGEVTGPKKLGTFGASYLYPIFRKIGVINEIGKEEDS